MPGSGYGDKASIVNFGYIKGFVQVFGQGIYDQFVFINEPGGVFEARGTSFMGGGDFFNEEGATVHTAGDPTRAEATSFTGLASFQNKGLISLQDGAPGDSFTITSGPYSYSPISFVGSGKSTLAVDAFLGGPGSVSDVFIVDGNVSGKTEVQVVDTNKVPGVLNKQGIPVIFVNGPGVTGDEFFLKKPIDTGFFDYDLFFRPTGAGCSSSGASWAPVPSSCPSSRRRCRTCGTKARPPRCGCAPPATRLTATTTRVSTPSARISASISTATSRAPTSRWG